MIDKKEIEQKAKEFEIQPSNVERDYVFGWMLFGLFTISKFKDRIFLKGGNALRKGYFKNTRFSTDLDLGMSEDIDQNVLLDELNNVCDFIQKKSGVIFIKKDNKIKEKFTATNAPLPGLRVYEIDIYFKDFYGNPDLFRIKASMDITRFDKVLLPIQKVKLIHPYSDFNDLNCKIRCMQLEEIIATKLKCLLQRQSVSDLFDYSYSIKLLGGNLNKKEVSETLIKKTIFRKNPHVLKNILKQTQFNYFKKCWNQSIVCAKSLMIKVEDAISIFLSQLDSLFSIYNNNSYSDFAYFGPELRVPIMRAGREQTLLKIKYKGADRIVEPYSLKYLQRRDGVEKEYFYAFNRSGGSHEPGIRCFTSENVENIENTKEKFTPRYQIELCKSGEKPENPYLFDPNKPTPKPKKRIHRRFSSSLRYVYKCIICGRRFTRKTQRSALRPHKDKNRNPCSGRYGYYVNTKY
jgi:predicted nucleotidyltransferase component of viral defense system/DNA-directed RNA polymerase subunit RPC12/RpoP